MRTPLTLERKQKKNNRLFQKTLKCNFIIVYTIKSFSLRLFYFQEYNCFFILHRHRFPLSITLLYFPVYMRIMIFFQTTLRYNLMVLLQSLDCSLSFILPSYFCSRGLFEMFQRFIRQVCIYRVSQKFSTRRKSTLYTHFSFLIISRFDFQFIQII